MSLYVQIKPAAIHVYPYVFALRLPGRQQDGAGPARKWCHEQFGTDPRFIGKKWDEERFGPRPEGTIRVRWKVSATRAKFLDEAAATAFKLRWC